MKVLIFILIIHFMNVNCGLLKELLTPVTEKVQNNELLNEHERKNEEPAKKGVLTNVVESLDAGTDKLVNLLTKGKGKKDDKVKQVTTKPAKEPSKSDTATQKPETSEKDVKLNTTDATTPKINSIPEDNKVKDVKTKDQDLKGDKVKDVAESSTAASSTKADSPTVETSTGKPEGNNNGTKTGNTKDA